MIHKIITMIVAAVAVAASSAAFAESASAPQSVDAKTWSQSIELLKNDGYTHPVIIQSAGAPGSWIGSASKDGHRVDVAVDAAGNVTQH